MASEFKRGAVRTLSNYARLFITLLLGVLFVPIFIMGVGDDAFGLLALLGSTIGIAEMCQAIARDSMNRELGAAYHSDDPHEFPRTYNSALVLTSVLAIITAAFFTLIFFLLPWFNISDELLPAAKWLLVMEGGLSVLIVLFASPFNMYMVTERMVFVNLWKSTGKAVNFVAAMILFVFLGMRDPAMGLMAFALLSAGGRALMNFVAVAVMISLDRRLVPDLSYVRWNTILRVLSTAGWNSAAVTATNMHTRLNNVIMNLAFGLMHNAAFGLAVRLTAYVRILAFANTFGLDVVTARISTREDVSHVVEMMRHATRIHALVAFPAGMVVLLLASPLMHFWVGLTAQQPATVTMAVAIAQILVIGMTAQGISDCWTRMLYGAGFIRAYAPLLLLGGLINPLLAVTLIFVLPETVSFTGPALSFAAILVGIHFLIIPFIAGRCLGVQVRDIVAPVVRPLTATLFASPLLLIPRLLSAPDSPAFVVIALLLFGAAIATLGWFYVLDEIDRERVGGAIGRRLKGQKRMREEGRRADVDVFEPSPK